jgi:hypothetical protein
LKLELRDRAIILNKKAIVLAYNRDKTEKYAEVKAIKIVIKYIA